MRIPKEFYRRMPRPEFELWPGVDNWVPRIGCGTIVPPVKTRTTTAYQDSFDGSGQVVMSQVGVDVFRVVEREDINGLRRTYGLLEPQETNRCLQSSTLATTWTANGTATATNATVDTLDPFGNQNASKCVVNGSGNELEQAIAGHTADAKLAVGGWIKRSSISGVLYFENSAGSAKGQWEIDLSALPDYWVRLTRLSSYITVNNEFVADATGNGGPKIYAKSGGPLTFYWAQTQVEENGGYEVTSDIGPTTTGAATRNADVIYFKGDDGNLGGVGSEEQGAIEICFLNVNDGSDQRLITLSDGGSSNDRMHIYKGTNGQLRVYVRATAAQADFLISSSLVHNRRYTTRLTWKVNNIKAYLDGVYIDGDTSCDIPINLDRIHVGSGHNDSLQAISPIEYVKIWRRPVRR